MSLDDAEENFDGGSELGRRVVVPMIASLQEDVDDEARRDHHRGCLQAGAGHRA